MVVRLLDHTKLSNAVIGARTCWDSFHLGGDYNKATDEISSTDIDLLKRLIFKHRHESISEHIVYTFKIVGITRAVLQELSRHRIASYSVKSTRYTLKELKNEAPFRFDDNLRASKYIDIEPNISAQQIAQLEILRKAVSESKLSLDELKPLVLEAYKCNAVMTINYRSLSNFLHLRTSPNAYYKIKELAQEILRSIPPSHRFLFQGFSSD